MRAKYAYSHAMRLLLSVLAGILIPATSCFARLGETPDQCSMRYGLSVGESGPFTIYSKDHIKISVMFRDGISVQEAFCPEPGTRFSEDQVMEFLTANSNGAKWSGPSSLKTYYRHYFRLDRKAYASFSNGVLTISVENSSDSQVVVPGKQPTSGF